MTAAPPGHSRDHHSIGTASVLQFDDDERLEQGSKQDAHGATGDEDKSTLSALKERQDTRPKANAPLAKTGGSNLKPRVSAPTLSWLGRTAVQEESATGLGLRHPAQGWRVRTIWRHLVEVEAKRKGPPPARLTKCLFFLSLQLWLSVQYWQ